jgi:hypothetical protein
MSIPYQYVQNTTDVVQGINNLTNKINNKLQADPSVTYTPTYTNLQQLPNGCRNY